MNKKEITTREDIYVLVSSFYIKVRSNNLLGPFFNGKIKDWDEHLERLTTFWESSLFLKTKYYGNPLEAHVNVDKDAGGTISELHFGTWINLWIETIDEHFYGEYADMAKHKARKMATFLYLNIFESRQYN